MPCLRTSLLRPTRFAPAALAILLALGVRGLPVAAAQSEGPVVLIVEVEPSSIQLDADALRAAIGSELGVTAVAPSDARALANQGTLRVRVDESTLEVEYEERSKIRRQVSTPRDAEATRRAAVLLAGNLARHEGSDLALWLEQDRRNTAPSAELPDRADTPPEAKAPRGESDRPAVRFWLGLTVEVDASGFSVSSAYHPDPFGNAADEGNVSNIAFTERLLLDVDYAVSRRWLLGFRGGFAFQRYPGPLGPGIDLGRLHLEARTTYLIDLSVGAAPYLLFGAGLANFDAKHNASDVDELWNLHGPVFVAAGVGLRIPFSTGTAAMVAPIKATLVFPDGPTVVWSPEVSIKVAL